MKERLVLHSLNLAGLVKIGGSLSIWVSDKSGYAFILFMGATTWFVVSNILLKRAKKRYPRFNRVCTKIRV